MNERLKTTIGAQMRRIQDMITQPRLSLAEVTSLFKHLGMMRMADIILRHEFHDESMHAKLVEAETLLENHMEKLQRDVFYEFQDECDVEDVISYAENEYGRCDDPETAKKVTENAQDIAYDYRHAMNNDDCWFYVLEGAVNSWLDDNEEG